MEKFYDWFEEKLGWRKEELDQNMLVAGILLTIFILVAIFVVATPGVKVWAVVIGLKLLKFAVYVLEGVAFLVFGLWFFGHFGVRAFIEYLDESRASSIALESWVHWLVAVVGSVVAGWLWTFVVSWTTSIPGYLQTLFVNWGWYNDGSIHGLAWWWVIGSLTFFFGYFWRGIKYELFSM